MFDYHVHSHFSADCDYQMEAIIQGAIKNQVSEMCFTDHVDYDYQDPTIEFDVDFDTYDETFYNLKEKYYDSITLKKGVEIGIQPHVIDLCTTLVEERDLDFVICSIHTCNKQDLYLGDFYKNRTPEDVWETYLKEVIYCAKHFKHFNVFGHLDIPKRYNKLARSVSMEQFKPLFLELFDILIHNNKGLEVNTSGFKNEFKEPLPSFEILQWYHDAGGRILTLGSDSHSPEHLGYCFAETIGKLKTIGFKEICSFEKMKPIFHTL